MRSTEQNKELVRRYTRAVFDEGRKKLAADMGGRPGQANEIEFGDHHVHIYRVRDGLIREHWALRDDIAMLRQQGALS